MDSEELNLIPDEALLVNLKKYLNYEISTFLLFALSFFSIIFIFLMAIAAIVFIPYVTYVLYRNDKRGWILTLLLVIILPTVLLIIFMQQAYTLFILLLIELAVFYFYCFTLRLVVNDWIQEITMSKLIDYQRMKRKAQEENSNII
ncbi:MAG TPA: hypothetical protein VLB50_05870 [Ignavibacteriaceae bacterium]|nr:hypothetical protein [Ignavibacteriaceae bacterium]